MEASRVGEIRNGRDSFELRYDLNNMETYWLTYVKWQSNVEKHRGYISTHRNDISYSALYAAQEDVFIKMAEGKDQGNMSETIYRMDKTQKTLLDNFLTARNQGLLFSKGNVDPLTGKPTIVDPDTNRPKYIWVIY